MIATHLQRLMVSRGSGVHGPALQLGQHLVIEFREAAGDIDVLPSPVTM